MLLHKPPATKPDGKWSGREKVFDSFSPLYCKESCRDRILVAFSVWDTDGDGFLSWEVNESNKDELKYLENILGVSENQQQHLYEPGTGSENISTL